MIRRVSFQPLSWALVAAAAGFAVVAGFQLGGGTLPVVPRLSTEILYVVAAGLFGFGIFATILRRPDFVGRIAPTVYVTVALLPLLRFSIPAIGLIRFLPLALIAPVVYGLYRQAEPVPSHTRVARIAMFAAFATGVSSIVANPSTTDYPRLALMLGGIVLLVGAAPRAWSADWQESVGKAVSVAFWAIVVSSVLLFPLAESFVSGRLRAAFTSPNAFGALIVLTVPITASRSRVALVPWSLAFVLMVLSGTRGGLIALSVACALTLLQKRRGVSLVVVILIGALVLASGVVRTKGDAEEASGVNTRELIWNEVIDASRDSLVTGYGFGSFDNFEFSLETQTYTGRSPQSHNSWLDALYEQGVLGVVPWVAAIFLGTAVATKAGPAWTVTLLGGAISATFESWMFAIGGGIGSLFWLVFGAAALGVGREQRVSESPSFVHDQMEAELPSRRLRFRPNSSAS